MQLMREEGCGRVSICQPIFTQRLRCYCQSEEAGESGTMLLLREEGAGLHARSVDQGAAPVG